jgi:hypothetical protein
MSQFLVHLALAFIFFLAVNWVGKHAVDLGYSSTTLFEEPNEAVALNLFIRVLSPAIFIVAVSAIFVAKNRPESRLDIFYVAVYYYIIRGIVIFALNRQQLVSWFRYFTYSILGILSSYGAYIYLILPNRSLLPDLDASGNELWLAIFAFLYAVTNKVVLSNEPSKRRKNNFVKYHYDMAKVRFGSTINDVTHEKMVQLLIYSIIVFEDYCRPPLVRFAENFVFWRKKRTTRIMQVMSERTLSDIESVRIGSKKIVDAWNANKNLEEDTWIKIRKTIIDYNRDDDYVHRVSEIMEIIAKRADRNFEPAYQAIWS